jgi:myosin-5
VAVEISLKAERQHNDAIMKQLADAQVEIVELQRNLEDADRRNSVLQDSLERFFSYLKFITQYDIISKQFPVFCQITLLVNNHRH